MTFDERAATMKREEIVALLVAHQELTDSFDHLRSRHEALRRQVEWFKRQLFGSKSERRVVNPEGHQLWLGEAQPGHGRAVEPGITVAEHQRRRRRRPAEEPDEGSLRFDASVPVEEIRLDPPTEADGGVVISEKVTYRLAQRPGVYVVLKYIRPVVKRPDGTLTSAAAPPSVLGRSIADVSLLANLAVDKFRYHLPLYRQHQRMEAAGIHLARSTLTGLVLRCGDLLEPVYHAQLRSILAGAVVTMDETPIKAGRTERRSMKTAYFWPVFGDRNEIAFPFSPTREASVVREVLGEYCGVLLSDGYRAYESYAAGIQRLVHAQCWSHTRRGFVQAEDVEPELAGRALDLIARLYEQEAALKRKYLPDDKRIEARSERCKPLVDEFFAWLNRTLAERILLPSNPFTQAASYALAREAGLRVFLEYPNVPIDTNHLEREIRPIALGRKNWLFCWTEVGAECVGIFQSLLSTCRLQGIDPYVYLVDVLQRVETHPASQVERLTPRLWKETFAADPLRSDLDRLVKNAAL
jgi:transposase